MFRVYIPFLLEG